LLRVYLWRTRFVHNKANAYYLPTLFTGPLDKMTEPLA